MSESFEMADDDRAEIVEEFLAESEQYLQVLNDLLLKSEDLLKGGDEVSNDDINAMFRAAHTIKGTASFLEFNTISHLTHEMETIMDRVRNNELTLTVEIIDVLFCAFDTLNGLLDRLRSEGNDDDDVSESVAKIQAVLTGQIGAASTEEAAAEQAPAPAEEPQAPTPTEESQPAEVTTETSEPAQEAPAPEEPAQAAEEEDANSDESSAYMAAYIEDTEQNIERFNEILLAFEKKDFKPEYVNELFRVAHTIKGSSGIIKRKDIETLAHKMEDILSGYREKNELPDDDTISLLFKGIDWIKDVVNKLQAGQNEESDPTPIINELLALGGKGAAEEPAAAPSAPQEKPVINLNELTKEEKEQLDKAVGSGSTAYRVTISVAASAGMKSMKALVAQERMTKLGGLIKALPKDNEIDDSVTTQIFIQYLGVSTSSEEEVRSNLNIDEVEVVSIEKEDIQVSAPEPEKPKPAPAPAPAPAAKKPAPAKKEEAKKAPAKSAAVEVTTMRIDTRKLDNLMNLAGELVITRSRFAQLVNELIDEVEKTKELGSKFQELESIFSVLKMDIRGAVSTGEFANVGGNGGSQLADAPQDFNNGLTKSFEEISNALILFRDVLSMKAVRAKLYNLDEAMSNLGKLSSDIQNGVMQTRMVQIEGVFTRFKRLVRDISKEVKKDVTLEIFGEETELDKKIVDELGDPLTHMIRNAIDHGLESPEDREANGKPRMGTVTLGALHKGNNICIQISDNGKGLDCDKIAQKAMEKGIVTEDTVEQMSEREKLNLIFAPGFSTAEQVTGLSGRGVGMDVVKKMIESLSGTVEIETELGKGTTFMLKIPLTLAIIQALLVVINGEVFAFPLEAVSEIIKVSNDDIYSIEGNTTIKLRGHALSLIKLDDVIKINEKNRDFNEDQQVVVITDGEQLVGVAVDRLIGEDEIVIKSLPEHFDNVVGISGASILGSGRISLILDVASIIREAQ